ncbi:insulin gene enhancer protein ISL-1-like isoform X2 [Littorina saxatilis]|uniref:insulin gene enhancer protein ISL-1-like isoform X2 n=1 Tax=Littorina saxatilis TaxID=31220 RepID=UPI0038B68475
MRYQSEPGKISPSKADEMAVEAQPLNKKRRQSVCVGCGSQIHDQYIMRVAPDLEWHAGCLKCADCAQYLDESCTCYVRDGKTYCKRDYLRLFGTKCSQCLLGFGKTDFVMRAKNKMFHVDCFRCVVCNRALVTGDEFALRDDGLLYCKLDNDSLERASSTPCQDLGSPGSACNETGTPTSASGGSANGGNNNNNNNTSAVNNNNTSSGRGGGGGGGGDKGDGEVITTTTKRANGRDPDRKRANHKGEHKTTRVRTVLNEKQLHTLRTCYNANPRPDALMKEQLTEMTSLSPRVIRVWFQNKRCKDKKRSILLKQIQQQQEKVSVMSGQLQRPLNGVPMVASSPVRHEGPPGLQANPVEVQSYQTPWKALSEFAMQGEMDHQHPPFQQLMNTFEHMDPGCHASPTHGEMMMQSGYHHHHHHHHHPPMHPHDDMPNSVGSDFPGTPSETMSSPLSQ